MLEALVLIFCIYVAIVAAVVTIMVIACSNWYIGKCTKMTQKIVKMFEEHEEIDE